MAVFTAVRAAGTLTGASTWIADADTVTIGSIVYRFKGTPAQINDIYVSATSQAGTIIALANLVAAINGTGSASATTYFTGTVKHTSCKAALLTTLTVKVTALMPGVVGNLITFTKSSSGLSCDAAVLGTTTAGSGSAHADINTWISGVLQGRVQLNSQVEQELERIVLELA